MKAGKYTIKELFVNRYLKQIVIPEIQRDYVWGKDQLTGLLNSIKSDFDRYQEFAPPVQVINDPELEKAFQEFCQKRDCASNIGFIYAYNDEEYQGRYFLIDGQQRITSMYLVLLTLASRNEELKDTFRKVYILDEKLKLDYKVREASHDFLFKLVPFILEGNANVKEQHWFYADTENDITSRNLLQNISTLKEYFQKNQIDEKAFFHYLENFTEFWYFDTNVSEQGEELYIYMNARGEQMQSNENIKADLLSHYKEINVKNAYGKLWEDWQDFFWVNKGKNRNADRGFNEFLACIAGLENYLKGIKGNFLQPSSFEKDNGIKVEKVLSSISLPHIQKYVKGLECIMENKNKFKELYTYSSWVDKSIALVWQHFNTDKTNWFANYSDDNRSTERQRMVFQWSVLHFLANQDFENININEVYRVLRMYYVRFNNFNRSVSTIEKTVNSILINGVFDTLDNDVSAGAAQGNEETDLYARTQEERSKIDFLNRFIDKPEIQRDFEEVLWELEDHEYNLNGRDVGGKNISYLLDLTQNLTLDQLIRVKEKFFDIFSSSDQKKILQSTLLYYGRYWQRVKPKYYLNLHFGDWRRTIRGLGSEDEDVFSRFFSDFLRFDGTLQAFYEFKKINNSIEYNIANKAEDLSQKILWYSQQLDSKMWRKGSYLAFRDWVPNDGAFPEIAKMFNTLGEVRESYRVELFSLLPDELQEKLSTNAN